MYYPEELIEEIRIQNDIINVISDYVKLEKKGNSYFGLCPFHNEKTPSFSVSQDKQMYYCFGCGAGGNVITFIMEYENYSFIEAIKYLADRANISLPEANVSEELKKSLSYKQKLIDANKEAGRYYYYQLNSDRGKKALQYLLNRGISEEIIKKFGLGYANIFKDDLIKYLRKKGFDDKILIDCGLAIKDSYNNSYYDRFFNRVMFPIFDIHNRVIAFGGRVLGSGEPKYLNSPETKLFDKSKNLYGLNIARKSKSKRVIIVEGYMDLISLHQFGFQNSVASLGTAFTNSQASLLKRYFDEAIIAYDSDEAGVKATLRAIPILERNGFIVKILKVEDSKDPDEYIKKMGKIEFERLIDKAVPSFIFEINELEKQFNLKDPDQKTKFYHEIAKKLVKIENEIKRESYIEVILDKYKIKASALQSEMENIGRNIGIISKKKEIKDKKEVSINKYEKSIEGAQINILTFIISHKDIFNSIKEFIQPYEFIDETYKKIAEIIFDTYNQEKEIQPAIIINKFTELEEQNKVARIFNNIIKVEHQSQFEKIINESIHILKNAYLDKMFKNVKDVSRLQELIKEKHDLQRLYISLNHG